MTSGLTKHGSTRAWRSTRAFVLQRDREQGWGCRAHEEGWCERAGRTTNHTCKGLSRPMHAHHTRGREGGDDPAHIVSACAPCNLYVGDPNRGGDPPCVPITNWGST